MRLVAFAFVAIDFSFSTIIFSRISRSFLEGCTAASDPESGAALIGAICAPDAGAAVSPARGHHALHVGLCSKELFRTRPPPETSPRACCRMRQLVAKQRLAGKGTHVEFAGRERDLIAHRGGFGALLADQRAFINPDAGKIHAE